MMNNEERAASVESYVAPFAKEMGLDPSPDADGPVTIAGDLITNLLHWVAAQDAHGRLAALDAMKQGIGNYVTETYIDYTADAVDELGPESIVTIDVECNGDDWGAVTAHESFVKPVEYADPPTDPTASTRPSVGTEEETKDHG